MAFKFKIKAFPSAPVFCARIVIFTSMFMALSTAMSMISSGKLSSDLGLNLLCFSIIFLHHSVSLLGPFKYFYGIVDIILLLFEYYYVSKSLDAGPLYTQTIETFTLYIMCVIIIYLGIMVLFVYRLATIAKTRGKALITPFEILYDKWHRSDEEHSLYRILGGRYSSRSRILGENTAITVIRSLCGFALMEILVFFTIMKVVLEPVQETKLGPIKEFRSTKLQGLNLKNTTTWSILIPLDVNDAGDTNISRATLEELVKVQAIWEHEGPQCISGTSANISAYSELMYYQFTCSPSASHTLPTLLMTVDFSFLPVAPLVNSSSLPSMDSLTILIGMTNTTDGIKYIMENTIPTILLPGINMVALVAPDVRQVFTRRSLAALGVFQHTTAFFDARIVAMYPDPLIDTRGTNKSSLRVIRQHSWANMRILQDYRQTSVIAGFSDVGGLWTILSGVFSAIFGMSMLRFVYGAKPLAIVGIIHYFRRRSIKEEAMKLYPKIIEEHEDKENQGLLTLIRDYLVDVSFLEKQDDVDPNSVDEEEQFLENRENNSVNVGTVSESIPLETSTASRRGEGEEVESESLSHQL